MVNYITAAGQLIADELAAIPNLVLYGENINNGSRIVGLARYLRVRQDQTLINVGNCEATHCGVGFGLMLKGVSSILFVKQLDFMLLGMDHFVNTYNFIRARCPPETLGSFTIITVVCDQGFQGPQSSLNSLADFCSLARVPGYTLTSHQEFRHALKTQLKTPGFRFIALSQRLFPTEFMDLNLVWAAEDASVFQYSKGVGATIVCLNFSLPQGYALYKKVLDTGIPSSLFSANYVSPQDWQRIKASVSETQKLIVIDDTKSENSFGRNFLYETMTTYPACVGIFIGRNGPAEFGVSSDELQIDCDVVISKLGLKKAVPF